MQQLLILSFVLVFLYAIYDLDVLPHYLTLINRSFFKIDNYLKLKKEMSNSISYLEYIALNKENFWFDLLSCANCMIVWIVVVLNLLCNLGWEKIGMEILSVWIGYGGLRWLMKKLYE